jgi:hypothetical protein
MNLNTRVQADKNFLSLFFSILSLEFNIFTALRWQTESTQNKIKIINEYIFKTVKMNNTLQICHYCPLVNKEVGTTKDAVNPKSEFIHQIPAAKT